MIVGGGKGMPGMGMGIGGMGMGMGLTGNTPANILAQKDGRK